MEVALWYAPSRPPQEGQIFVLQKKSLPHGFLKTGTQGTPSSGCERGTEERVGSSQCVKNGTEISLSMTLCAENGLQVLVPTAPP